MSAIALSVRPISTSAVAIASVAFAVSLVRYSLHTYQDQNALVAEIRILSPPRGLRVSLTA